MKKARKNNKREVAKCPDCENPILLDHPYTWCSNCGERLSPEIQLELPKLDGFGKSVYNPSLLHPPVPSLMDSIPARNIIWKLRERAASLRTVAGFIMFGIISLVLIGVLIFSNAGYTAQQETSPALKVVNDISESLHRISLSLNDRLQNESGRTQLLQQINSFETIINSNIEPLKQSAGDTRLVMPVLVSSISQRLGIIILLIFLLQILVPTYRYNHKLAAYYSARADALEIMAKLPDANFESLVAILSPDSLDFGKTIPSPTDHVLEVVKEAVKVGRSNTGIK